MTRKFSKSSSPLPEPFQMDEFENDSDSDYNETESEEIVEHRNAIARLVRQIKASVRFDL